jgi:surfeit locus 1 family protein
MDATVPSRRFPIGLTIASAIVFTICCGLGVWQLGRKAEKTRDLARIAARQREPARPLADVLNALRAGQDERFVRVTATCPGLERAPFSELYAVADGRPGVRLVSACRVESAGWGGVLVDRGFVDSETKARPPVDAAATAPVQVTGVLYKPDPPNTFTPKHGSGQPLWFWRDVNGMAAMLGLARPAPLMMVADVSTNPDQPELRPVALPGGAADSRKGEYAPTWFGLALVLAAFYAAMLTKRLRGVAA